MKSLLLLLTFFCWNSILAQSPEIQWQKCLGGTGYEEARAVQQTIDGGYVLAGYTNSPDGNVTGLHGLERDFWVTKMDSAGGLTWQKALGGSGTEDAYAIQQTSDQGYVVAGYAMSNNGDVSGNHSLFGLADYWVVKLFSSSGIQWQKCLGGTNADYGYSLVQTNLGSFVIAGATGSNDDDVYGNHYDSTTSGYNNDYWVALISGGDGTLGSSRCLGGQFRDDAYAVDVATVGGFYVAGNTFSDNGDVSGQHSSSAEDIWVVRTDDGFGIIWQKCLGGTGQEFWSAIQSTSDGGCIVTGFTWSDDGDVTGKHNGASNSDAWVVKLDINGNIQWQKCLGGSALDRAYAVQQTSDGGYIIAGQTESNDGDVIGKKLPYYADDLWVVKLDESGNLIWQKCLGGTGYEYGYAIKQTMDGGYIVAGSTSSNNGDVSGNHGNIDYWVVKLAGALTLSATHTDPTCQGNNGAIDLTVSGGSIPYSYHWSNNKITQDLTGLAPGPYTVIVTDNAGKTATDTFEIAPAQYDIPINLFTSKIKSTSAILNWTPVGSAPKFTIRYRLSTVLSWTMININNVNQHAYKLTLLNPSSTYKWQIRENCSGQKSAWSAIQTFTTLALKIDANNSEHSNAFKCYPNPTSGDFTIEYSLASEQEIKVLIMDLSGRTVLHETLASGAGIFSHTIDLHSLNNGSYIINLDCRENSVTRLLMITK